MDIIYISDVADYQALNGVLDIISSGRLVIMITEADSAADTITKIMELVPKNETDKILQTLADVLLGIVVQQLVPRRGGGQPG